MTDGCCGFLGGKFTTSHYIHLTASDVKWTLLTGHDYDGRFVNLYNGSQGIGLDVYKKHVECRIIKTECNKLDQFFDSDPGIPFPTIRFVLKLRESQGFT